jgi:hypothetical protein
LTDVGGVIHASIMTIRIDQAQPAMPRESLILSEVIPLGTYPRTLPNVPVKLLSGVEAQTCRPGRRRIWLRKAPPQPVATDTGKPLGEGPGAGHGAVMHSAP